MVCHLLLQSCCLCICVFCAFASFACAVCFCILIIAIIFFVDMVCHLLRVDDSVLDSPVLSRVKRVIAQKALYQPREKQFVRASLLAMIELQLRCHVVEKDLWRTTYMWMLTAYAFLLRHAQHLALAAYFFL